MRRWSTIACVIVLLGARHRPLTVFDLDRPGSAVPPIAVALAGGGTLALDTLRGTPTFVFLFASWCAPCSLEMPWIRKAFADYGNRVRFLGIDVLDSETNARTYVQSLALPFDVAIVPKSEIDAVIDENERVEGGQRYRLPATFLIDAQGVVRSAWHGIPVAADGTPVNVLPERLRSTGFVPEDGTAGAKVAP